MVNVSHLPMHWSLKRWFQRFLGCGLLVWLTGNPPYVCGQGLSFAKKAEGSFALTAQAPAAAPHMLQASANLRLWVDLLEEAQVQVALDYRTANPSPRFFQWVPRPESVRPIRVVVIGDSTVSEFACGWGRAIFPFFNAHAQVVNYAYPWTSTRVFLQSEQREKMILIQPDYVIMEFGYVDANSLDPNQTTTLTQYADNLKDIAATVRSWNGVPILLTLHAPRAWDEQGRVIRAWADRSVVVRQVAKEIQAPLVDLHELSADLYERLGPAGSKFLESECIVNESMHFSLQGGQVISSLVVNALPPELGPYLSTEAFEPQPKP